MNYDEGFEGIVESLLLRTATCDSSCSVLRFLIGVELACDVVSGSGMNVGWVRILRVSRMAGCNAMRGKERGKR